MRESLTAQTTARIELLFSEDLSKAMQRLEENRFDAIVLDLFLPDTNGVAVTRQLKEKGSGARILILKEVF